MVLNNRELFDFVTRLDLEEEKIDEYLTAALEDVRNRPEQSQQEQVSEAVFMQAFIPRTLEEVIDIRRDIGKLETGREDEVNTKCIILICKQLLYATLTGLTGARQDQISSSESDGAEQSGESNSESGEDSEDSSEEDDQVSKLNSPQRVRGETAEERKLRKQMVKEQQKKKRETKVPKAVKKRRKKLAKNNKRNK